MKWFKHDSNAHRDVKLKKLMMRHGLSGYGLYFYCLELITDNVEMTNLTFQLESDAEIIAHETGLHQGDVELMMKYMVELGLFEDAAGVITCLKLAKRLDSSMTSNPTMRTMIGKIKENHDGVMTGSCKNRVEESRLDKIIKEKSNAPKVAKHPDYVKTDLDKQLFDYRKDIKKPLKTQRGLNALISSIIKTSKECDITESEAIELMMGNEWQTIKPSYLNGKQRPLNQALKASDISGAW